MIRRLLFVSILILGSLGIATNLKLSTAQDDVPSNQIEIGGVNDEDFPELTVLVNVWDEFGVPVPDLGVDDFELTVDGTALPILQVENITRDNLPISVVLVIDTSESMFDEPLVDAKAAALALVDQLDPADEIALIGFGATIDPLTDFTTDRDLLRSQIEGLNATGRTALYDATYYAAELAQKSQYPRRFVVFLTDGNEYGGLSTQSAEAGLRLAAGNNVPFYVVGIGFWLDEPYLNSLASATQGEAYFYPNSATLAQLYEYLGAYLRTQNVVTVSSDLEPDGATHELAVTANGLTEVMSYTAPDLYPQLTFEGLPEDAISEPVTFSMQVSAARGLGTQTVTVDGAPLDATFDAAGENGLVADITLDPYAFEPGVPHSLVLNATDAAGGIRSATVEFSVSDLPPVVEIVGLDEGAFISEDSIGIGVTVTQAQQPLQAVEYRVDGQVVAQVAEAPYAATIDVLSFGAGDHTLEVALIDASGEVVETRAFTVDPELFVTPTATPTNTPTVTPTEEPTQEPTATPTEEPTQESADLGATADAMAMIQTSTATQWTAVPSATATEEPTEEPTATEEPTEEPTVEPSATEEPTQESADLGATADAMAMIQTSTATQWTAVPSATLTEEPTEEPTATEEPTEEPTVEPSATEEPTEEPTTEPTGTATDKPEVGVTVTATQEMVDVAEEDESGTDLTDYWPLLLVAVIVLVVVVVVVSQLRQNRTQAGG